MEENADQLVSIDALDMHESTPHATTIKADALVLAAMNRLLHDLVVPIATMETLLERQYRAQDHSPQDALSMISVIRHIIGSTQFEIDLFTNQPPRLRPAPEFIDELINRAVKDAGWLLKGYGISESKIIVNPSCSDAIPRLYVDKSLLQLAFYHIFSNCIYFAGMDRSAFLVTVDGYKGPSMFNLIFQDWGEGIPLGAEDQIFEAGVRGPNAIVHGRAGKGMGLYIVRQIVMAHGGNVAITNHAKPTEITLRLPITLETTTPRPQKRTK